MRIHVEQGTQEWLDARVGCITASVAAGALGIHPHMSRAEAWRRCLGTQKESSNDAIRWGQQFEPIARYHYEIETGFLVQSGGLWVHDEYPWLKASPDGLIGNDGALEIKCGGKVPDKIPAYHRVQCIVQLLCTGRSWVDYFAWTPNGFYMERVHPQGAAGLVNRLRRFYETYVLPGVEPPRKKPRRRLKSA